MTNIIKKITKIVLMIVAVVILLLAGAVTVLVIKVDQEMIKSKAVQLVYDQTGRELKITGDVSWSFFPSLGIKVQDIALSDGPGFNNDILAQAGTIVVSAKLWPLIFGRIEAGQLFVKDFTLRLIKNNHGISNWQNLLAVQQKSTPPEPVKSGNVGPIKFTIDAVTISNGNLLWHDQQTNKKIEIKKLRLHCKHVNFGWPWSLTGDLEIGNMQFEKLSFNNFSAKIIGDNGLINWQDIVFDFYQGQGRGEAYIDVRQPIAKLDLKLALKNVAMQPLLIAFAKYGKFGGVLNLDARINARGATTKEMFDSTGGDGQILIAHGVYRGIDVPYEVRRVHAMINAKPGPQKTEPPQTAFERLAMNFTINNAVFNTDNLLIQASDYQAKGEGKAHFVANQLDFALRAYSTHDDSFFVPIRLVGVLSDPTVKLDVTVMLKHSIEKVVKDIIRQPLEKRLKKLQDVLPFK